MAPIPFTLPDDGLTERKGTVRVDEEFLVIHLQTSFVGEFNKKEKIFKIDPKALDDASIKKGFFRDVLQLVPRRPDLFEAIPGVDLGFLGLRIWKKHRTAVEELLEEVERRIVGF